MDQGWDSRSAKILIWTILGRFSGVLLPPGALFAWHVAGTHRLAPSGAVSLMFLTLCLPGVLVICI